MEPDANEFAVHSVTLSVITPATADMQIAVICTSGSPEQYLFISINGPLKVNNNIMKRVKQDKKKISQDLMGHNQQRRPKMDPGSVSVVTVGSLDLGFPVFTHWCQFDLWLPEQLEASFQTLTEDALCKNKGRPTVSKALDKSTMLRMEINIFSWLID